MSELVGLQLSSDLPPPLTHRCSVVSNTASGGRPNSPSNAAAPGADVCRASALRTQRLSSWHSDVALVDLTDAEAPDPRRVSTVSERRGSKYRQVTGRG